MRNYVAPRALSEEFLLPNWLALSIHAAEECRGKVEWITGSIDWFKGTYSIHWLAKEVYYHVSFDWYDEEKKQEKQTLEQLMEKLLEWTDNNNMAPSILALIDFMKNLVSKYWEKFYQKMLSFDAGEKEDNAGNNRMYQSSRLWECVLLWIRLGVDATMIECWKSKLKQEDASFVQENIFPENIR